MTSELTVVIPTYNELENIQPCIRSLASALEGISWEAIFVDDDSTDKTAAAVREAARKDPRIRCIQRLKRRGLSSACMEGILASSSPYVCVMDADLQHDEKILPEMIRSLKAEGLDIVIGSRYAETGSTGQLARYRVSVSRLGTLAGSLFLKQGIKDPLSGFFMLRRDFFEQVMRGLSGRGFKILLDILASCRREIRYREIPYTMRERSRGESKLDPAVAWDFLMLMVDKTLGRIFPIRFVLFASVGLSGVFVHFLTLGLMFRVLGFDFVPAQLIGTYTAMTSNFVFNNLITFGDLRLRKLEFLLGLVSFYVYCSFGAFINVILAGELYDRQVPWFIAGLCGAVVGAIWNYAVTSVFTWHIRDGAT